MSDTKKKTLTKKQKIIICAVSIVVVVGCVAGIALYGHSLNQNKDTQQAQDQNIDREQILSQVVDFGFDANTTDVDANDGHIMLTVHTSVSNDEKIVNSAKASAKIARNNAGKKVTNTAAKDETALKDVAIKNGYTVNQTAEGKTEVSAPEGKEVANTVVENKDNETVKDVTVVIVDDAGHINVAVTNPADTTVDADKDSVKDVVNNAGGHVVADDTFNNSTVKDEGVTQTGGKTPQTPSGTPIVIDKNNQPTVTLPEQTQEPQAPEQNTGNAEQAPNQSTEQTQTPSNNTQAGAKPQTPTQNTKPAQPSGHWETRTVVDKPAWTETIPGATTIVATFSDGHVITGAPGENITSKCSAYMKSQALKGIDVHYSTSTKQLPGKTINHPAQTHTERVWVAD